MSKSKSIRRVLRWTKRIIIGLCVLMLVITIGGLAMITFWPDIAAQNIDRLRDIIGDAPVAQLETLVLDIQDHAQQLKYQLGLVKPEAPWGDSTPFPPSAPSNDTPVAMELTMTSLPQQSKEPRIQTAPAPSVFDPPSASETPSITTSSTAQPNSANNHLLNPSAGTSLTNNLATWQPAPLMPFGKIAGEGQWLPYLQGSDGKTTVAYRTFLQPDPARPYSVTAIVAFNLQATRLHFVLGTDEPRPAAPQPSRTGTIPDADRQPGVLLATFNGGFKSRHGNYGAMADGLIALPAIRGLATVAMYADGHVQIGEWGTEIQESPDLVAWRQNGKMLIHSGTINPDVAVATASWGATIKGDVVTWRSAIGLSADGHILYYAAAQEVDVAHLAKVLERADAANALQLDVNDFWVHFAAIRSNGPALVAEALLRGMFQQVDRYLKASSRDFFYVTSALPGQ